MIDPGNAVREVWKWREEIGEEIKDLSPEECSEYFRKSTEAVMKDYGLKYYNPNEVYAK